MSQLQLKDIPQELLDKITERFEADPRVRQMRVRQQVLQREGKFREALALAQEMDALRSQCVYEYMAEADAQVERVDVSDMAMPVADKERMMQLLLVCFMCADMIESSVMDMDSILHRHDKGLHVEMFDDIRSVMSMSKEKLQYLQENSGYMKDLVWAEKCDDMYAMMQSKAGAIMRKRKTDKNWGKNKADKERGL